MRKKKKVAVIETPPRPVIETGTYPNWQTVCIKCGQEYHGWHPDKCVCGATEWLCHLIRG